MRFNSNSKEKLLKKLDSRLFTTLSPAEGVKAAFTAVSSDYDEASVLHCWANLAGIVRPFLAQQQCHCQLLRAVLEGIAAC